MSKEVTDAFSRVEHETHHIVQALELQNQQHLLTITRLDQIIALLTPKDDAGEPALSDLLAHLIAQGREQLILTRRAVDLLVDLQQNLPARTVAALETYFSSRSKG